MHLILLLSIFLPDTRSLKSLTLDEVECLFSRLKLNRYLDAVVMNEIDGECLYNCDSVESLVQLGIQAEAKAMILLEKIKKFKNKGVPLDLLIPATGRLSQLKIM